MTVPFLDMSRHVAATRSDVERAIGAVLDGGRFIGGPPLEAFEAAFAAHCGAAHCVGVASGTDAVAIALLAAGVEPGDEVITAANTCVPTVAGIEAARAVPVLADVDEETATLDPASLPALVGERTRAILPVHLYGQCADMEPIAAFARAHGLQVVEDAAQAHGAAYGGRAAGTLGRAAAFSFYPTKNLGALGDAGAVVTNDSEVAERARLLRSYGERERDESVLSGRNSRLDTLQAAVLQAKLGRLDEWNDRRRALALRYLAALPGHMAQLAVEAPGRRHAYHLFVVRTLERDRFRAELRDRGVETLVHYPRAIHEQPAYRHLARPGGALERSERLCREVVSLPLYPELRDDEADAVVAAVEAFSP